MPRRSSKKARKPDADLRQEITRAATAIFHREFQRALLAARLEVREVVRKLRGGA